MSKVYRTLQLEVQGLSNSTVVRESPDLGLSFVHESLNLHRKVHSTSGGL